MDAKSIQNMRGEPKMVREEDKRKILEQVDKCIKANRIEAFIEFARLNELIGKLRRQYRGEPLARDA
jgi:hypothetical protein